MAPTVRRLADVAHLSEFHFCRMFRRATGLSPHQFIQNKRMEVAKDLLANSDIRICLIPPLIGLRTQAHFTCVFKKHCGETPAAYRRRRRGSFASPQAENVGMQQNSWAVEEATASTAPVAVIARPAQPGTHR